MESTVALSNTRVLAVPGAEVSILPAYWNHLEALSIEAWSSLF